MTSAHRTDVALGIDVGTSGVRVAAVDATLQVRATATAVMPAPVPVAGRMRQHAKTWWDATCEAMAHLDLRQLHVRAVAVDGTSGTILPVSEDGTPLEAASMYNDVASDATSEVLAGLAPHTTAALGRTSPLARAIQCFAGAPRIVHQADWIAGQLSGRFDVTDENNALKTGYDPLAREWPAWVERAGVPRRQLPAVVSAGTRTGTVRPDAGRPLGLPSDVAVVAGTTDGCAAFLASGASACGDGVTSLGTTLTVKLLSAGPVFAPEFGVYSHRLGDLWLPGGASNTGGGVLATYFTREELQRLSAALDPDRPTALDYYPLAAPGERFPICDPGLQPRLQPRPADDATFLQAMLEGMAAIEARAYRLLADLGASPLTSVRTMGGGAANEAWTRIRLQRLAVPGVTPLSEHAAVGAARLAWRGLGHAC